MTTQSEANIKLADEKLEIDPELCSIDSEFEMFSDLFDFKALAEQPDFGIKKYKQAVYRGQIDSR